MTEIEERGSLGYQGFSLGGIVPPFSWRFSLHEPDSCDKHIDDARVMAFPAENTQVRVHFQRIKANQLMGLVDSQKVQIPGRCLTDIGYILKTAYVPGLYGGTSFSRGAAGLSADGGGQVCCSRIFTSFFGRNCTGPWFSWYFPVFPA